MSDKLILVIDDECDLKEVIETVLDITAGWRVIFAGSGSEGIVRAEQEQPDAILLDLMMPGMDGISTLKQLKAIPNTSQIPVLLLTAKMGILPSEDASGLGYAAMLEKPFDPLQLARQVAEILGWPIPPSL